MIQRNNRKENVTLKPNITSQKAAAARIRTLVTRVRVQHLSSQLKGLLTNLGGGTAPLLCLGGLRIVPFLITLFAFRRSRLKPKTQNHHLF